MRRSLLLALVALACLAMPNPVLAQFTRCMYFSGTADALIKSNAVDESQKSLRKAIDKWKAETGVTGPVSETAEKPRPVPYWRSEVDPSLFLPPDEVSDTAYTLCWKGVVSPVVCTTGAKVCW
ncbi:MAG TPA: hypothetical protein VIQ39_03450 [Methyloceanibacter sp.]|jgi:hypothetical protein